MFDAERNLVIEPHEPHRPLGVIHLAGEGMKERRWTLKTLQGGTVETRLTYSAVQALAERAKSRGKSAARQ